MRKWRGGADRTRPEPVGRQITSLVILILASALLLLLGMAITDVLIQWAQF